MSNNYIMTNSWRGYDFNQKWEKPGRQCKILIKYLNDNLNIELYKNKERNEIEFSAFGRCSACMSYTKSRL